MRTSVLKFTGAAALVLALTAANPFTAGASERADAPRPATAQPAQPAQAAEFAGAASPKAADGVSPKLPAKSGGTNGTNGTNGPAMAWGYQIMPSCSGLEAPIRRGANYWQGATETPGSGKPVECTNGLIADCFGTANAVGCNYGPGRKMVLSTQVSDFALLAAHEFGHEWHPHSAAGCMNWASAYEVMRPTIC